MNTIAADTRQAPGTPDQHERHPSGAMLPEAAAPSRPVVLAAVDAGEAALYPAQAYTLVHAHTTMDALRLMSHLRPSVVVIDWEVPGLDGAIICQSAAVDAQASVLVTTTVGYVPAALRAGCHGVLLKPFAPNLLAGRIGRLLRGAAAAPGRTNGHAQPRGTNRVWNDVSCTRCGVRGATGFDFSSYRRMWYACLSCEHVWLGDRRE